MLNNERIKFAFTVSLLISIFAYHLTNYYQPDAVNELMLFKIAQIAIVISFAYIFIYNKYFVKILFREYYIAGNYEGHSYSYKTDMPFGENINSTNTNIEYFGIKQNIFETNISGKSFKEKNNKVEIVSTWFGRLFKCDGDSFYFAIELTTSKGEYGVLKLTHEKGTIHGFYYSGDPNTPKVYAISANKK